MPLQAANDIVDKLAPEAVHAADAAALAVTNHVNDQGVDKDSEAGRLPHAMASQAYSWHVEATQTRQQTDVKRKELEDLRTGALDALSKLRPPRPAKAGKGRK